MKFHKVLEGVLGSKAGLAVAMLFLKFPTKSFSGREAGRLANLSPMAAWKALKVLQSHGLIGKTSIGNTDIWKLNKKHFLTKRLSKVIDIDSEATQELYKIILKYLGKGKVEEVIVFGSFARKEERPDSDIDVIVVASSEKDKEAVRDYCNDAASKISDIFHSSLSTIIYSKKEFAEKKESSLVKEIRRDGEVIYTKKK